MGGNEARSRAPPSRMREETHAGLKEAVTAAHSTCSLLAVGTGPFCALVSSRSDSSSFPSFPFLNWSHSPSPVYKSPLVLKGLYPAPTLQALWLQGHLLISAEGLEPSGAGGRQGEPAAAAPTSFPASCWHLPITSSSQQSRHNLGEVSSKKSRGSPQTPGRRKGWRGGRAPLSTSHVRPGLQQRSSARTGDQNLELP